MTEAELAAGAARPGDGSRQMIDVDQFFRRASRRNAFSLPISMSLR